MNRIDAIKIGLLLTAIAVWFAGFKWQNRALMTSALALIVFAFGLRFYKPRPPGAPSS